MWVPTPDPKDGLRRYGLSYRERTEDISRCVVSVSGRGRWPSSHQCNRPRGHGPDGLYCKQHTPDAVQARRDEADRRYREESERRQRPHKERADMIAALKKIRDGHNDPRSIAESVLKSLNL